MSYSFDARAASKAEAKQAVAAELDLVVVSQPLHVSDRDKALAMAEAFIDLVRDPGEDEELRVLVNGCLGHADELITTAAAGVNVYVVPKNV